MSTKSRARFALFVAVILDSGCAPEEGAVEIPGFIETRFDGSASPPALVELGRHLFHDRRLSVNEARACATCHEQKKGFTDGFARSIGATLQMHPRNAPTLTNVVHRPLLNWRHPTPTSLEAQLLVPLLGTAPVEMGMGGLENELLSRLANEPTYQTLFAAAFPEPAPFGPGLISLERAAQAIAAFERTLVSDDSPFDRFRRGQPGALSEVAREGMAVFFGPRGGCGQCHNGPDLDRTSTQVADPPGYFNVGLYDVDGAGAYPAGNQGLVEATGVASDMGRFRVPTLRNVAVTGPYFHDGSTSSLRQAIQIHLDGGRWVPEGPRAGDGRMNPLRDPRLAPRILSARELWALEVFLRHVTDEGFLTNPAFADPWPSR